MFRVRRPDEQCLARLRDACRDLPLNYTELGCVSGPAPPGYVLDNYRIQLGDGIATYERAKVAMREWRMLYFGWVEPCWPDAPIDKGVLVGTLARVFGVWAVNVCRIVSVVDEPTRFGFTYGTLLGHAERGEERFLIERKPDEGVWFEVQAVSRPAQWLTRIGYPLVRRTQRRFGQASLRAMQSSCGTKVQARGHSAG